MSFGLFAVLIGFTLHLLIKILAGSFGVIARMTDSDLVRHGIPVAVSLALFAFLQFNSRTLVWGDEVVAEIRKVVWPAKKDVSAMTIVVLIFVAIASFVITAFDLLSGQAINILMK